MASVKGRGAFALVLLWHFVRLTMAGWRYETRGALRTSVALGDTGGNAIVFIGGDDRHLHAVDAFSGQRRWRYTMGDTVTSSAALGNATVFVGNRDQHLYALDVATGAPDTPVTVPSSCVTPWATCKHARTTPAHRLSQLTS